MKSVKTLLLAISMLSVVTGWAQKFPLTPLPLEDMSKFKTTGSNWQIVGDVVMDRTGGLDSLGRLLWCGFPRGLGVGSGTCGFAQRRGGTQWLGHAVGAGARDGGRAGSGAFGARAAARVVHTRR